MRLVKRCKKKFIEKIDWEVYNLIEDNQLLQNFDKGFEIESRVNLLTAEVKLRLFKLYFNQKLLAFLWHRIEKNILKENRWLKNSEPSIFGTKLGANTRTNFYTSGRKNFQRKRTKDSIDNVRHVADSFRKFEVGQPLTPRVNRFLTKESDTLDSENDILPSYQTGELQLRFKQALEVQKNLIKKKQLTELKEIIDSDSSGSELGSASIWENPSRKRSKKKKKMGGMKGKLKGIRRFKNTRKKLKKDPLYKVLKKANEFKFTKVLIELERLREVQKAKKRLRKKKRRNKNSKSKSSFLKDESLSKVSKKKKPELPRIKIFTIEQLKNIANDENDDISIGAMSIISREIQDLEDEESHSGFYPKMNFYFSEVDARCLILAFFKIRHERSLQMASNYKRRALSPRKKN